MVAPGLVSSTGTANKKAKKANKSKLKKLRADASHVSLSSGKPKQPYQSQSKGAMKGNSSRNTDIEAADAGASMLICQNVSL